MHTEEGRHKRKIVNNDKKVKGEMKEFVLDKTSGMIGIDIPLFLSFDDNDRFFSFSDHFFVYGVKQCYFHRSSHFYGYRDFTHFHISILIINCIWLVNIFSYYISGGQMKRSCPSKENSFERSL